MPQTTTGLLSLIGKVNEHCICNQGLRITGNKTQLVVTFTDQKPQRILTIVSMKHTDEMFFVDISTSFTSDPKLIKKSSAAYLTAEQVTKLFSEMYKNKELVQIPVELRATPLVKTAMKRAN